MWLALIVLWTIPLGAQMASWQPTPGLDGGTVMAATRLPDSSLIISTNGGGIYRSEDQGINWELQTQSVMPLSQLWTGNGTLLTIVHKSLKELHVDGAGTIYGLPSGGWYGLYRSADQGRTWQAINPPFLNATITDLALDAAGNVYVTTGSAGVYRSTDAGGTWEAWGLQDASANTLAIDTSYGLYVGTETGLFFNDLSDSTWTQISQELMSIQKVMLIDELAVVIANRTTLGVFESGFFIPVFDTGDWIYSLQPMPDNQGSISTREGIFVSVDPDEEEGVEFRQLPFEAPSGILNNHAPASVLYSDDDVVLVSLPEDGLYVSTDGGINWERRNAQIRARYITDLTILGDDRLVARSLGRLQRQSLDGQAWERWTTLNAGSLSFLELGEDTLLLGADPYGIHRLLDGGLTWEKAAHANIANNVWSLTQAPNGLIFGGVSDGVVRSEDRGETWETLTTPGFFGINNVAVSAQGILFASGQDGVIYSQNNGDDWQTTRLDLCTFNTDEFLLSSNDHVFAVCDGLHRSTDQGVSWDSIGFGDYSISAVAEGPSGNLFVSTVVDHRLDDSGLYQISNFASRLWVSADNGDSWQLIDTSLQHTYITDMVVTADAQLYAATAGNGIYQLDVSNIVVTSTEQPASPALSARLELVAPNPFSSQTNVEWSLPASGMVELQVTDLLGRPVANLLREWLPAGTHRFTYTPNNLTAGLYLVRLRTKNGVQTQRLLYR